MKPKAKRALFVIGAIAGLGLGVAVIFASRTSSDAKLLSPLPPLVTYTPRSAFNSKPRIDIPWFGGKRLKYPAETTMPKNFRDNPGMSGFMTWDKGSAGAGSFMDPSTLGPYIFSLGEWKEESGVIHEVPIETVFRMDAEPIAYAMVPNVYGHKPKRLTVEWFNVHEVTPAANTNLPPRRKTVFELPANGREAPVLKDQTFKVGSWTLSFQPRPLIGPNFLPEYDLTIKGSKEDIFLLEFEGHQYDNLGLDLDGLIVKGDTRTLIRKRWNGQRLTIRKVVNFEKEVTARLDPSRKAARGMHGMKFYELRTADGKVLITAQDDTTMTYFNQYQGGQPLFNLRIGSAVLSSGYAAPSSAMRDAEATTNRQMANKLRVAHGQKFKVTGFRQVAKATAQLDLKGPLGQAGFIPPRKVEQPPAPTSAPSPTKPTGTK